MPEDYDWEVVCISCEEESEYDDCRSIGEIGLIINSLSRRRADTVAGMIESGHRHYIEVDDQALFLQAAQDDEGPMYVRTSDTDTPDDPLLSLPSCEAYEQEQRMKRKEWAP